MKIVQYRFSKVSKAKALDLGNELCSFFASLNDYDLYAVNVDPKTLAHVVRRPLLLSELARVAAESFAKSFEQVVNYEKLISIKSSHSCRFVVFEDDGLLRMCYSHSDECLQFSELSPRAEDVSQLAITTDLFDSF